MIIGVRIRSTVVCSAVVLAATATVSVNADTRDCCEFSNDQGVLSCVDGDGVTAGFCASLPPETNPTFFANSLCSFDGVCVLKPIPTISEWTAIGMILLLLVAGTIVFFRKRGRETAVA